MDYWMKAGITTVMIIVISDPAVGNSTNMNLTCHKPINGTQCPDNKVCPVNCDEKETCPCMDGFKTGYTKVFDKNVTDCEDINECRETTQKCAAAYTQCKNTRGGYYCECEKGFRNGNLTQFCPSDDKSKNQCTDIDECKENPRICGPNKVCNNTPGGHNCSDKYNFMNISNKFTVKCRTDKIQPTCNADKCNLDDFETLFTPSCDSHQDTPTLEMLLGNLGHLFSDKFKNDKERLQNIGKLLKKVERIVQNLAPLLKNKNLNHKGNYINVQVINSTSSDKEILLKSNNSSVKLDGKMALGDYNIAVVGSLEYSNISNLLRGAKMINDSKELEVKLVSPVVSVFLGVSDTSNLSHPVELHINFTDEVEERKMKHCAFWSTNESSWSRRGCVTKQRYAYGIVCTCTHLTSFAVLMALEDIESWTLDLITRIGLSISIFCLVLAIITFCFCRSLRGTGNRRKTIHTHLSLSLLLANCIFLFGIEAIFSKPLCGIVAGLLHALYLAAFCWMSLEGLELYLMLVRVFNTQLKTRYLLAVGYGVPAVIVTISAAVFPQGYGTEKYCWLSRDLGFNWSFMGPVCVIILINCGIFVLTVWKLTEKMTSISPEQGKLKKIRTLTVTSIAQLCILGCCWVFGFLMLSTVKMFFAYAFTICNVLQGIQIFFLHCLIYKKVRAEYRAWLCAIVHLKAPVYSEFSNSSNVNTHSRVKATKESGL